MCSMSMPAGATPMPLRPKRTVTGLATVSPSFGETKYTAAPSGALEIIPWWSADAGKVHASNAAAAAAVASFIGCLPGWLRKACRAMRRGGLS